MYLVTFETDGFHTVAHEMGDSSTKLGSAKIARAVNSIDSFSAVLYPDNPAYNRVVPFATKVEVVNTETGDTAFEGRVIQISPDMGSDGLVTKTITCEGPTGYLNDSIQTYTAEQHYNTLTQFITKLLECHNSKVEDYKKIYPGEITLQTFETSSGVTKAISRATTWDNLQDKLVNSFGGEMQVRRGSQGLLYLDYKQSLGTTRATKIEIARNMQAASREVDFNSAITRLYVYGAKQSETITDENGQQVEQETENRLTIASLNGGREYIDDAVGIEQYGIIEGYVEFDDVTQVQNLLTKGQQYLGTLTALPVSHTITALDLSYLGLDYDDFRLHDSYPCYNPLIDIDETLEIVSQTIDINEPLNSTFDLGDSAFRLSGDINDGDLSDRFDEFEDRTETSITNVINKTIANTASIKIFDSKIEQTVQEKVTETVEQELGTVITSVKTQYYLSQSQQEPQGGAWSDSVPTGEGYLFVRTVTTYNNGTVDYADPYCITQEARTVTGAVTEYYRSTSAGTQEGGAWSTDYPDYAEGTYLWIRTTVNFANPEGSQSSDPTLDSTWAKLTDLNDKLEDTTTGLGDLSDSVAGMGDEITDISQLVTTISDKTTQLTQTAEGWTYEFQTINTTLTEIAGTVDTEIVERLKYIKFIDGEIWLGRDPDPGETDYKVVISNERIRFLIDNVEVAYISGRKLYIYDAQILNRLTIGEFAFYPRDNGNMTLRYIGEVV